MRTFWENLPPPPNGWLQLIKEAEPDQNEIPVILYSMIDAVLTTNLKQTAEPSAYDFLLLQSEEDLIESEQNCQQYKCDSTEADCQ